MDPVYTEVTNITDHTIILRWVSKSGYLNLDAGATVKVDGDLWTFNTGRRVQNEMIGDCVNKHVSITLNVLSTDGTYHQVEFSPMLRGGALPEPVTKASTASVKVAAMPNNDAIDSFISSNNKDNIIASSDESSRLAKSFGIAVSATTPDDGPSVTVMRGNDIPSDDNVAVASKSVLAGKTASVEAPEKASTDIADEFNALTAAKKWQEAYDLLVATFGADKVTFTPKTIMTLKTFSSVNKKYKLIEE